MGSVFGSPSQDDVLAANEEEELPSEDDGEPKEILEDDEDDDDFDEGGTEVVQSHHAGQAGKKMQVLDPTKFFEFLKMESVRIRNENRDPWLRKIHRRATVREAISEYETGVERRAMMKRRPAWGPGGLHKNGY